MFSLKNHQFVLLSLMLHLWQFVTNTESYVSKMQS